LHVVLALLQKNLVDLVLTEAFVVEIDQTQSEELVSLFEGVAHVDIILLSSVLADKLQRILGGMTDLQKWVVGVDAGLFAVLAKVLVVADRAHVADTTNRELLAAIALDAIEDSVFLVLLLFDQMFT
jgi:hypothetical protein